MKSLRCFASMSCFLALSIAWPGFSWQATWGRATAGVVVPAEEKLPVVKKKIPPFDPPILKPKQLPPQKQLLQQPAIAKPQEKLRRRDLAKQLGPARPDIDGAGNDGVGKGGAGKGGPANRRHLSAERPPLPSFWSRRQSQLPLENLSRASVYQLGSMGQYVHLTPAMRWHLQRSGAAVGGAHRAELSSAATVPGQGAGAYYPGVGQTPAQKPFANLERPASGLQRYWPLLMEGREDPNTGLIHWSLP